MSTNRERSCSRVSPTWTWKGAPVVARRVEEAVVPIDAAHADPAVPHLVEVEAQADQLGAVLPSLDLLALQDLLVPDVEHDLGDRPRVVRVSPPPDVVVGVARVLRRQVALQSTRVRDL